MQIYVTGVFVDDQAKALAFYTEKLGFIVKRNIPVGQHRWLTLVSDEGPGATELLLEPAEHPAVGPYRAALGADGIPLASFRVTDMAAEYQRLIALGARFVQTPQEAEGVSTAVLDDTCGNLIQLVQFDD